MLSFLLIHWQSKFCKGPPNPLATRILQLAADIGLDKFLVVGGFAEKTGGSSYLQSLQDHMVRLCHASAYFRAWTEARIRSLVAFGHMGDNDALIGIGVFVQHLASHYYAVEKAIGTSTLSFITRSVPTCGAKEILVRPIYTGICTTDLQMLSGVRPLEPIVLGHEGVSQVMVVGKHVRGLKPGTLIVLNPNNPLDDYDKIGHNREGLFQTYYKFGDEFLQRKQVLILEGSIPSITDTLIEPLSCIVAALKRIADKVSGKNVLVIGAGIMGLIFIETCRKFGSRSVFLTNRSQTRLDYAVKAGIISKNEVFLATGSISSQLKNISKGDGADAVIVCASMGQGLDVTRAAIDYINDEGLIYLFAGFCPEDTLDLPDNTQVDIMSIRSGWKTQQVSVRGKSVYLSGHRGSKHEDLATATTMIRSDRHSFRRLISHVISLDILPEIMQSLEKDGSVRCTPARRVIIDMSASGGVVECIRDTPFRQIHEASKKHKYNIPMSNPFREIELDGDSSMLG